MEKIPVFVPTITGPDTKEHVNAALTKGWLGMGEATKEFEERISDYLGLEDRYVVIQNTGTSALHCAVESAGIKKGDEVIVPSFNFAADQAAIEMAGGSVAMCDIRENNLGIDCEKAESLINEKTKAIMPLHFAGIPCDQKGVYKLAEKYNLRIIEDATHSFGTTIDGKKIGSFGDMTCFSFDPVKIITAVDGGCVIVNTEQEVHHLRQLRLLGIDTDPLDRAKGKQTRGWNYDIPSHGYRYHMNTILATIGISQIKRIDEFISSRRKVCQQYNKAFEGINGLRIPQTDFSNISPFIYTLRILDGKREDFIQHLMNLEIDTGIHFMPVHQKTYFKNARCNDMTVTNKISQEIVTIPLHSNMKLEFVQRIISGVTSFFNKE